VQFRGLSYVYAVVKDFSIYSSESAPNYNDKTPEELDRLPPGYYTYPMKRSESPPPGEHPGEPQTPNMTTPVSYVSNRETC